MITRGQLRELLGIEPVELTALDTAPLAVEGRRAERLVFERSGGERIVGHIWYPPGDGPHPAILYAHAHGNKYDMGANELTDGRPAFLSPLGPVFAAAGYVTLCIDMPTFGARQSPNESALSKARLWYGKSEIGLMLSEPEVRHRAVTLAAIPGSVPPPDEVASQCAFASRCQWRGAHPPGRRP